MQKKVLKHRHKHRRNNQRVHRKKKEKQTGPKKCEVCNESEAKYKCPTCRIPFCSVPCSKKHKETKCTPVEASLPLAFPPKQPGDNRKKHVSMSAPRRFESDIEDSIKLTDAQLELLDLDPTIQQKMKDSRLADVLRVIQNAADSSAALDTAMQDSEFLEFCDDILGCIRFNSN